MVRVPLPLLMKHPVVTPEGQGSRTTGVPACCSAMVPISIAVALEMFVPLTVTVLPPAIVPEVELRLMPLGTAGSVPTVVDDE